MSISFGLSTSLASTATSDEPNTTNLVPIEIQKCKAFYGNNTGFITNAYEGIPENLIVNLCVWTALIVLYTLLRNIGDYGRFGLIKNDEESWTAKFFGNLSAEEANVISSSSSSSSSDTDEPVLAQHFNSQNNNNENNNQNANEPSSLSTSSDENSTTNRQMTRSLSSTSSTHEHYNYNNYKEKYFFSWIINMFKLKNSHINEKSGHDATYYLVFQRYLIVYQVIITIISLTVILPINLNGKERLNAFDSTTILNVVPESSVLWIYLIVSWFFLAIGILFMRKFCKQMEYTESEYVSRTLLITNFPLMWCKPDLIYKHFRDAYPDFVVTDVQFAYDTNKLTKLEKRRKAMHIGKITSEKIFESTRKRPKMHPYHFGSLVELCCGCCRRVLKSKDKHYTDSIEFYTKNEDEIKTKMIELRERVLKKPLNILFITFQEQKMADSFLKHYRLGFMGRFVHRVCSKKNRCTWCYLCRDAPKDSQISETLNSDNWSVKYAPSPHNIKWENISKFGAVWWFRVVLINIVLFILMIFFTTPSILIEKIMPWASIINISSIQKTLPSYLAEFLPSMILRILAAILPIAVAYTALAELHWTRSAENRSMMIKTFTLLLFMVLILPTLGLTSINALFEFLNSNYENIKWRCVSDNGAFFLKYVTTCSLIGTALDLLRLPDLFLYIIRTLWSRSSAERLAVRIQATFEFDYGIQYAWILTLFTVALCFSVVCPLITPCGLIYLLLKHMVDRYNLFFAYKSTKVDKNIHKTAVTFTIAAFIVLQFSILFFIAVRNKGNVNSKGMATVQIIVIVSTMIIFFGRLFFGFFKRFSPFKHKEFCTQTDADYEERIIDDFNNQIRQNNSYANEFATQTAQPVAANKNPKPDSKKDRFFSKINFKSPYIPRILQIERQEIVMNRLHKSESKAKVTSDQVDQAKSENLRFQRIATNPEGNFSSSPLAYLKNNSISSVLNENNIEIQLENEFSNKSKENNNNKSRDSNDSPTHYGTLNKHENNNLVNLLRQSESSDTGNMMMINEAFEEI